MDTFNSNETLEEKTKDILLSRNYLSTRLFHCLMNGGYKYLSDVVMSDPKEFCKIRNLGKQSQEELEQLIQFVKFANRTDILCRCSASLDLLSSKMGDSRDINHNIISEVYGRNIIGENFSCTEKSGYSVYDCSIKKNDVSQRTYNILQRLGIQSIRALAETNYTELKNVHGLGELSFNEILKIVQDRTIIKSKPNFEVSDVEAINMLVDKIKMFLFDNTDEEFNQKTHNIFFNSVVNNCVNMNGNIVFNKEKIQDILHSEGVISWVKDRIHAHAGENVFTQVTYDDIKKFFYNFERVERGYILGVYEEMISSKMLVEKNGFVYQYKIFLQDWLLELHGNEKSAVSLRFAGCTLEEIGKKLGVTRERARQIISKVLKKRPEIFEDGYKWIFEKYSFSDNEFEILLKVDSTVINYLKLICGKRTEYYNVHDLINDNELPQICKERAAEAFKNSFLFISGELLPLKRDALLKWVLKKYYSDSDCTIDELESFYYVFLEENELRNNDKMKFPSHHAFEARVIDSTYCVLKYGKRIRYFDMESLDFNSLLSILNLEQYDGLEISTLKLLIDNADLFEELDIRDEYELHNILRKHSSYLRKWDVTVGRMPFVSIGNTDRFKQVRELLYQLAPIPKEDLAMEYEVRYGVKKETVLANFLGEIDVYLNNGIYDIAQPELSPSEFKNFEALLVDDIYMWDEVVGLYVKRMGGSNVEAINSMTLKQLGFKIYSEYMIRSKYPSAEAFFTQLLTKNNQIEVDKLKPGIRNIQAFYKVMNSLRDELDLIELGKSHFVRFDYFKETIVECTKEDLRDIGKSIVNSKSAEVFSVKNNEISESINKFAGIINNIYFLNSIVRVQDAVKTYLFGDVCVIAKNGREASLLGMMMELLRNRKFYEISELIDAVYNTFGITIEKHKVVHFLSQEETVEVDSIMGIVRLKDKTQVQISEKPFWLNTPYEEIIIEVKSDIYGSKVTINGVYWKERYKYFVEKCREKELVLMGDLIEKDIEKLCEEMLISRLMTSDIIQVFITWAKELKEKKKEDTEDILSLFFK